MFSSQSLTKDPLDVQSNPQSSKSSHILPRPRTVSRIAATQALFQKEIQGAIIPEVIEEFMSYRISYGKFYWLWGERFFIDAQLFSSVLHTLHDNELTIQDKLAPVLPDMWPFERLDALTKSILKLGATEIFYMKDAQKGTIIDEYVNVAHAFLSEKSPPFIHGVLDALVL